MVTLSAWLWGSSLPGMLSVNTGAFVCSRWLQPGVAGRHPAEEVISTARSRKEAVMLGVLAPFLERYK